MTMKLRYAPGSPFVRKVTVSAIETGLEGRIERIATDVRDPETDLPRDNPLGRVPALIREDGRTLIESSVICAYLDSLHDGPRLIPADGEARWEALYLEALADGMAEAAIAVQRERARPRALRWDAWETRQWTKVVRALDALEREPALYAGAGEAVHIGHIALGCALGWIELRLPDKLGAWGARWPTLNGWSRAFAARPSMQATVPV